MSATIPPEFMDLFEKKSIAYLATRLKDDSTQVHPVWCDHEAGCITFNSAKGRLKDRNVRNNPAVTLCIVDPDNPFRYMEVRGKVERISEEDADDMIDRLAQRYLGVERYPNRRPDEVRVKYSVRPARVFTMG